MIRVTDFYANKLNTNNRYREDLPENAIVISGEFKGEYKDIIIPIFKKCAHERLPVYSTYDWRKAIEFWALIDWLYDEKEKFLEDNRFSEDDFRELLLSLRVLMARKYTVVSALTRLKMLLSSEWDLLIFRIKRAL